MKTGFLLFFVSIFLSFFVHCLSTNASAENVKIIPRLVVGAGYDDNVLFTEDETIDSSVISVKPGAVLDYQTLLSKFVLSADFDILSYLDESDLDTVNQYYRLKAEHQIKNRWNAEADLAYTKDTTFDSFLEETGRVVELGDRDYFSGLGSVTYYVTEISSIYSSYQYVNAVYGDTSYIDYDFHRVNFYYQHRLRNEVDTLSIGPSYYRRQNDLNTVDSLSLDLAWARDLSDRLNTFALIGGRFTNVEQEDGTEEDTWGARAQFDLTWKGQLSTLVLSYYHDLGTTEDGDDINIDNFSLNYDQQITERFGAGFDGRLVFSYSLVDQQSDVNDRRYYRLEPFLFYRLTENLRLSLRYSYQNNVESFTDGDVTKERNRVWLQFNYSLPMML